MKTKFTENNLVSDVNLVTLVFTLPGVLLSDMNAKSQIISSDHLDQLEYRLRSISEHARKLLVQIVELAYHGRGQQRKADVAYLPELYESCGLGVEAMYPLLDELRESGLIEVEDRYPFEDVKLTSTPDGANLLRDISRFCESKKVSLRDVIVDFHFDLLQ